MFYYFLSIFRHLIPEEEGRDDIEIQEFDKYNINFPEFPEIQNNGFGSFEKQPAHPIKFKPVTDHKTGGPIKYHEPKFPQFPGSIQYEPSPVIYESPEPEITYPGSVQYEHSPVNYEPQKITYPGSVQQYEPSPVKYELPEPEITYQSSGGGIHQNFQQTFTHSNAGFGNDRNKRKL